MRAPRDARGGLGCDARAARSQREATRRPPCDRVRALVARAVVQDAALFPPEAQYHHDQPEARPGVQKLKAAKTKSGAAVEAAKEEHDTILKLHADDAVPGLRGSNRPRTVPWSPPRSPARSHALV